MEAAWRLGGGASGWAAPWPTSHIDPLLPSLDPSCRSCSWSEVKTQGPRPRARCCTALFALEQRVLMFGGDTYGRLPLMQWHSPGSACSLVQCECEFPNVSGMCACSTLVGRSAVQEPSPHANHASPCRPPCWRRRHKRAVVAARPGRGGPRPLDAAAAGLAGAGAPAGARGGRLAGRASSGPCLHAMHALLQARWTLLAVGAAPLAPCSAAHPAARHAHPPRAAQPRAAG